MPVILRQGPFISTRKLSWRYETFGASRNISLRMLSAHELSGGMRPLNNYIKSRTYSLILPLISSNPPNPQTLTQNVTLRWGTKVSASKTLWLRQSKTLVSEGYQATLYYACTPSIGPSALTLMLTSSD